MLETNEPIGPDLIAYQRVRGLADVAAQRVRKQIEGALSRLGDRFLVRGQITAARIKSMASVRRKAGERNWAFSEALAKSQDLVGLRLVCNNLQDVLRASDLLQESLEQERLKVRRKDYISKPTSDGYRAIHLVFTLDVRIGDVEATLGCEVQIRSLLQESWAQLSRADIYGNSAILGPGVGRDMVSLASLLARADSTAERIRKQISKPRRGRRPKPGQTLTGSTLAFIYRRTFGEDPPDYVVQGAIREFGSYELRTDGLETSLQDERFVARLRSAYAARAGWDADSIQIFRWILLSLVIGPDSAVRRARSDGRSDWREVASIARRETMSSVPKVADLLAGLEEPAKDEDPESDLESWAGGLGATSSCAYCGATIVHTDTFADAAVRFYKLRGRRGEETRERLRNAAESLAIETGSWDNPSICSYCSHMLNKDD